MAKSFPFIPLRNCFNGFVYLNYQMLVKDYKQKWNYKDRLITNRLLPGATDCLVLVDLLLNTDGFYVYSRHMD